MSFKQEAIDSLQELSADGTEDDLYDQSLRRTIQAGEEDIQAGRVFSQEQVEAMVERWLAD